MVTWCGIRVCLPPKKTWHRAGVPAKDGNQLTWKVKVSGAGLFPPAEPRAAGGPAQRTGSSVWGCIWRSLEIVVRQNSGRGSAGVVRCMHWGADRTNLCPHSAGGRKSETEVLAGPVPSEAFSLARGRPPSPCVLTWSSLYLSVSKFSPSTRTQSGWSRAQPSDLILT